MAATRGERGTEENLRAALGATVSVIDEVRAINKALADALAAARLVLVIASDKAKHDSSATLTKIDDALRLAGRLP